MTTATQQEFGLRQFTELLVELRLHEQVMALLKADGLDHVAATARYEQMDATQRARAARVAAHLKF